MRSVKVILIVIGGVFNFSALCQGLTPQNILEFDRLSRQNSLNPQQAETFGNNLGVNPLDVQETVRGSSDLNRFSATDTIDDQSVRDMELASKLFGYSYFQDADIDFAPNLNGATPKDYILGPGDVLIVEIFGTSEAVYERRVNAEGKINIPRLGPLVVSGFSTSAITSKLKRELSKIYSGLKGDNPTVFLETSLKDIRSIRLNIVGEVERPGNYLLPAYANVLNALYAAGGPKLRGTFRSIKVFRGNSLLEELDLYDFFLKGKNGASYSLSDNDIIMVNSYQHHVEIVGEVKRPGVYEIAEKESVASLIEFAGGFTADAFKENLVLERTRGGELFVRDVLVNDKELSLLDGDRLIIKKFRSYVSGSVQIEGAVNVSGLFQWKQGLTLREVLERAGGLRFDAMRDGITVIRRLEGNESDTELTGKLDLVLNKGDLVVVPSLNSFDQGLVKVSGSVNSPSFVPYFEGMSVWDAIALSGGLNVMGSGGRVDLIQGLGGKDQPYEMQSIEIPSTITDIPRALKKRLQVNSRVIVRPRSGYRKIQTVEVSGEINFPGDYLLSLDGMKVSDLVKLAGGVTEEAYLEGATLQRRNESFVPKNEKKEQLRSLLRLRETYGSGEDREAGTLTKFQEELVDKQIIDLQKEIFYSRIDTVSMLTDRIIEQIDTFLINKAFRDELDVSFGATPELNLNIANPAANVTGQENSTKNVKNQFDGIGIELKEIMEGDRIKDIRLAPGDKLYIPQRQEIVRLRGEVLYPTSTTFQKGLRLRDYVAQAGGYTLGAKRNRGYVIYPNGAAAATRNFLFFRNSPKILPGTEIVIPGGRQRQGLAGVQQVFGILTGAASVVTSYFLVRELASSNN